MAKAKAGGRGYVLRVDGRVEEAAPKLDLQGMYDAIGCDTVQLIQVPHGEMWMDENGKLTGQAFNDAATKLFVAKYGPYDVIVGDVYLRVHSGWVYKDGAIVKAAAVAA
jgi:hypothetical protein